MKFDFIKDKIKYKNPIFKQMTKMSTSFIGRYLEISKEKNSILCVGLDPAIPKQRETNTIPSEDRFSFMKQIIEQVSPYASVIKINRQYIIGLKVSQIVELNKLIHSKGMLSIIDHKLSDIGSTNASAIFWITSLSAKVYPNSSAIILPRVLPPAPNCLEMVITAIEAS